MATVEHTVAYCQSMATLTSNDWVAAAIQRLASDGVDSVKVETLAAQLGVSKGSFYWHFGTRQDLLDAMISAWEAMGTDSVIRAVEAHSVSPVERLRLLTTLTFAQPEFDGIELGMRAWARHDSAVAAVVRRVDARRVDYVSSLLEATGLDHEASLGRADLMYRTLIGEFVLRSGGAPALPASTLDGLGAWLARPSP